MSGHWSTTVPRSVLNTTIFEGSIISAQFGRSPVAFQREVGRIFGYCAPWRVLMVPGCVLQAWAIE